MATCPDDHEIPKSQGGKHEHNAEAEAAVVKADALAVAAHEHVEA